MENGGDTPELNLLEFNANQLRETAEKAEEASLEITKAVKFNRLASDAESLLGKGHTTSAKLCACIKLVKALLPTGKP